MIQAHNQPPQTSLYPIHHFPTPPSPPLHPLRPPKSRTQPHRLGAILANASFHGAGALPPGATDPNPSGACSGCLGCTPLLRRGLIISASSTSAPAPALELARAGPAVPPPAAGRRGADGPATVVAGLPLLNAASRAAWASRASLRSCSASSLAASCAFFMRLIRRTSLRVLRLAGEPSGPPAEVYFSWFMSLSCAMSV